MFLHLSANLIDIRYSKYDIIHKDCIVYYTTRHEAKEAYSKSTIKLS